MDTHEYDGTTREHFEETLFEAERHQQVAVLSAILTDYPPLPEPIPGKEWFRSEAQHQQILAWVARLETGEGMVAQANIPTASEVVRLALADAQALQAATGPTSAVDRVHTAMHGYLKQVCDESAIAYPSQPTMTQLLKALRREHPAFDVTGPRDDDIRRVINSLGSILDALNPVRNNASVAHPNDELLGPAEATLVINTVTSLLTYLEARIGSAR